MEVIKKIVSLESFRSHTPAIVPFYRTYSCYTQKVEPELAEGNNNAWGNVMCDYEGYSASTMDLFSKYFKLLKIRRSGKKMKRVRKNGVVCYTDYFDDDIRDYLYKLYSIDFFEAEAEGTLRQFDGEPLTDDDKYVSLVSQEDYDRYEELGGDELINLVESDMIGMVNVPSDITGVYVPEKFYLSEVYRWLNWFTENEKAHKKKDCCDSDEWNKRGGDAMRFFLQQNVPTYTEKLDMWRSRLGQVKPSVLSIPVFLTQNYDDFGTMSVYDEEAEYYGNEAGNGEPYTDGVKSLSKLQTLRTKTRKYDDNGNVLPYVGNGDIPYKVNEGFNVSYDPIEKEHIADYIKKITYFDENGNETSNIANAKNVEFEYVIGGSYNPNTEKRISVTTAVDTITSNGTSAATRIEAASSQKWVVLSNCNWFVLMDGNMRPVTGGTGSLNTRVFINQNTSTTESRVATIVIATASGDYEEAMASIVQQPKVTSVSCTFAGSDTKSLSFNGETSSTTVKIVCKGSSWYVKSAPKFTTITPQQGRDGTVVSVNVLCDKYEDTSVQRTGTIVFAATNNANVTHSIQVTQTAGSSLPMFMAAIPSSLTISNNETSGVTILLADASGHTAFTGSWSYEVVTGNTSLFTITRTGNNKLNITNKNTAATDSLLVLRTKFDPVSTLTATIGVLLQKSSNIGLYVSPTSDYNLAYGSSCTYTVTVSGDTQDNWNVTGLTNSSSLISVNRTTNNKFTVTNKNTGDTKQVIGVYVGHNGSASRSQSVSLTLQAPIIYTFAGAVMRVNGYPYDIDIEIWSADRGEANSKRVISTNGQETTPFPAGTINKDLNNKYYIRLNAPSSGNGYATANIELINMNQYSIWKGSLRYGEAKEFYGNYFQTSGNFVILIKISQ